LAERPQGGKAALMKLAILETGHPPGGLEQRFGDYPQMMARMLGDGFDIASFDVAAGELPDDASAHHAYLITGSPAGVYDPLPWIDPLQQFIREARQAKMVGICFGHQVMSEALGGHVEKSSKGWGAGLQNYSIVRREPWMDGDAAAAITIPASHQDQVVVQPPNSQIVAASDFTPYAALAWTDRPAISFQFHPEFTPEFAKALISARYDAVPNPDAAIASLDAPNDSARVGGWIRRFLTENAE
jgi:GMP synthase-like glutamine amidotransferase